MKIFFGAFSQRGTNKPHNEDALLLNGKVHQGRVRESGTFQTSQPSFFAIADGVSSGTNSNMASRRLLELLQTRLSATATSAPLMSILHQVQQDYMALGADTDLHGMASTLAGVQIIGNEVTIFNVSDSRAYLLTDDAKSPSIKLLSRDHSALNDMIDDGEITLAQSENAASLLRGLSSQFMADAECDDFRVNIVTHDLINKGCFWRYAFDQHWHVGLSASRELCREESKRQLESDSVAPHQTLPGATWQCQARFQRGGLPSGS